MIKFSIILNSRKRTELLTACLESIKNTTSNIDEIEAQISCDEDDTETLNWVFEYGSKYKFAFFEFIPRDRRLFVRFDNIVKKVTTPYILILNDDAEILTKNWDNIAFNLLENSYKDGVVYGRTICNSVDKQKGAEYSSFPIISKKACDVVGYFMNPEIVGLGNDVHIWRIYNEVNRIIDLPINIRHTLHETVDKVVNCDLTAAEMREFTYQHTFNHWDKDISKEVQKLKDYIINNA